jgi:hypothetical protein
VISPVSVISLSKKVNGLWSDIDIPMTSGFDKTSIIFENNSVDLAGEFRIRYGHGDQIFISGSEVSVSTFFGGSVTGSLPVFEMAMSSGGSNYQLQKKDEGKYAIDLSWSAGEGFVAQVVKTETGVYPIQLFFTGDGISDLTGADAWKWELNNFEMIPAYSKPWLFWKIVWLKNTGSIRFAPQRGATGVFGKAGTSVDGLYTIGAEDVPVPGTAGYYMIAVNLQTRQISIAPPKIYLIGSSVNSWIVPDPTWQLTIDNFKKEISIIRNMVKGTVKMYVWQKEGWFTNWWDAEISTGEGKIIYRGFGPNLPAYNTETGSYTAVLNFYTGAGKFEKCTCNH